MKETVVVWFHMKNLKKGMNRIRSSMRIRRKKDTSK